ncbi:MAG: hypothetical protein IKJ41_08295 [Clostridia bacterium]|nr:hypothetical protein [Clostridia bacterium]
MKEFIEKFYETRDTWLDLLDNVNAYVFGEEKFDEDMFADAMRGAFEVFAKMHSLETIKVMGNSEVLGANHLMILIGTMREYAADRYTEDTENIVFRASQLATRLLVNGAVNDFLWHDDGILPADELIDYIWLELDDNYVYDITQGDLSELIKVLENQ